MKDVETGFAEVEKRVRGLIEDNRTLRDRVAELERELTKAVAESEKFREFHGKQREIREKIERILRSLEAVGENEQ